MPAIGRYSYKELRGERETVAPHLLLVSPQFLSPILAKEFQPHFTSSLLQKSCGLNYQGLLYIPEGVDRCRAYLFLYRGVPKFPPAESLRLLSLQVPYCAGCFANK
jgi:hypothetical protein